MKNENSFFKLVTQKSSKTCLLSSKASHPLSFNFKIAHKSRPARDISSINFFHPPSASLSPIFVLHFTQTWPTYREKPMRNTSSNDRGGCRCQQTRGQQFFQLFVLHLAARNALKFIPTLDEMYSCYTRAPDMSTCITSTRS